MWGLRHPAGRWRPLAGLPHQHCGVLLQARPAAPLSWPFVRGTYGSPLFCLINRNSLLIISGSQECENILNANRSPSVTLLRSRPGSHDPTTRTTFRYCRSCLESLQCSHVRDVNGCPEGGVGMRRGLYRSPRPTSTEKKRVKKSEKKYTSKFSKRVIASLCGPQEYSHWRPLVLKIWLIR